MLIEKSMAEYICLLNNDTIVYKGWLKKLIDVLKDDSVGAVGPSTNQCHTPQKVDKIYKQKELVDFGKEYNGKLQLSGFCLLFPKRIWEEVGGFNEKFGFYAQENEFLLRVQRSGYKTIWRKDAYVWHKGEASGQKLAKEEGFDIAKERELGNRLYQKALKQNENKNI